MNFLRYFHFNKREEADVVWESFVISLDRCDFFLHIRKSNSKKGIQFFENITELIQHLAELGKRDILMLLHEEIDFL